VLNNWRRLDPNGPLSLDNLVTLHNFLNGWDESWFYLVTLEVESSGAPALLPAIQLALMFRECAKEEGKEMDLHAVLAHLEKLKEAILAMTGAMKRMKDGCEPFIFYHRVRPFLAAWKSNPTLPNGIIYEGVSEEPMEFYGGSAAQSALIPLVDITLGISHASTNSNAFLMEMRNYMFRPHRELLAWLEETPGNVKELIESLEESHPLYDDLKKVYNKCVRFFHAFRSVHTGFVREYIVDQQRPGEGKDYSKEEVEGDHTIRKGLSNSAGGKGTGGTDLEEFLTPINNNTRDSVIGEQKED
jgi:indoleamine 2,3-dioxygenase